MRMLQFQTCHVGVGWFLYVMFVACICALNVSWFILVLLGHPIIAHFVIPKSIPAHSQYLSSLFSCFCSDVNLFVIITRSSTYVAEFIVIFDVPSVYPCLPFCSHRKSGSRNIINKYGLRVSP